MESREKLPKYTRLNAPSPKKEPLVHFNFVVCVFSAAPVFFALLFKILLPSSSLPSAGCTLRCASNLPCVAKSFLSAGLLGGRIIDVNFLVDKSFSKFNFCGRIFGDRGDEAVDDVDEGGGVGEVGEVGEKEEEEEEEIEEIEEVEEIEEDEEVVAGGKVEEDDDDDDDDRFL